MTIKRLDHVSVVVDDLPAAVAFFTALGMTMEGEAPEDAPWEQQLAALAESGGNGESGAGGSGSDEMDDEKLLREAIALVKRQKGASASLLQRKMRIGYPKAARLIDQMEEMGIIGPPEAAGRLREVLVSPDDETGF